MKSHCILSYRRETAVSLPFGNVNTGSISCPTYHLGQLTQSGEFNGSDWDYRTVAWTVREVVACFDGPISTCDVGGGERYVAPVPCTEMSQRQ